MTFPRIGLLPKIIVAITTGLLLGGVVSPGIVRGVATFNDIFAQFLGFSIPLIILGLVAPGIADLGKQGGRLLLVTVFLAYAFTLFSGFFSYLSCSAVFPHWIGVLPETRPGDPETTAHHLEFLSGFFVLEMPPVLHVTTALILAFILGIGAAFTDAGVLKQFFFEFRSIIEKLIVSTIIPLLPLHVFGIFLNMSHSGAAFQIIHDFGKVILVIFVLHLSLLLIQYSAAGLATRRNPLRMLWIMLPAYMTALGTSSSAATIPVTLAQARKLGIDEDIADFCIPLCATIHLSGSMLKIVASALAICMLNGLPHGLGIFTGFIFLLALMMVAAPGVPGGAIMASIGVLQSVLGFDEPQLALMIAIYLAIDSFGTAGNVTGDGAIALIVDRIHGKATHPAKDVDGGNSSSFEPSETNVY